ncbi:MAG: DUF3817 domain-containing protein [Vicingaceae bacterium]
MDIPTKQLSFFRKVSLAEGSSFLLLLLIAMPLKYLADIPEPVKYLGWLHGVLFIVYLIQLCLLTIKLKWKFKRLITYFIAAFLPIAPFLVEKQLKKEYAAPNN